jgi:hypothetical protein
MSLHIIQVETTLDWKLWVASTSWTYSVYLSNVTHTNFFVLMSILENVRICQYIKIHKWKLYGRLLLPLYTNLQSKLRPFFTWNGTENHPSPPASMNSPQDTHYGLDGQWRCWPCHIFAIITRFLHISVTLKSLIFSYFLIPFYLQYWHVYEIINS